AKHSVLSLRTSGAREMGGMGGLRRGMASIAMLVHLLRPSEGFRALGLAGINRPRTASRLASPSLATKSRVTSTPTSRSASQSASASPAAIATSTSTTAAIVTIATSTTARSRATAALTTMSASPASSDTLEDGGGGVRSATTTTTATTRSAVASESPPREANQQHQQQGIRETVEILGQRFERWTDTATRLADEARDSEKPLLLYLPGIEGLGTSIETQLPALSEKFRVFRLIIGAQDRSTFSTLAAAVVRFVDL
ncbi:unnamed protein product, partial [Laminaria digitata]